MPKYTKEVVELGNLLQTTDAKKAVVGCYAVADILSREIIRSTYLESKDGEFKIRMAIKRAVDTIGEIAIIDRTMLDAAIQNSLKYKLRSLPKREDDAYYITSKNSFLEMIDVNTYFSNDLIKTIDDNLSYYKDVVKAMSKVRDQIEFVAD